MGDTIFYATAQSEPLPVDHEYSWRKARWVPQASGVYGLELGCSVRRTRAGVYCAASRTACVKLVTGLVCIHLLQWVTS